MRQIRNEQLFSFYGSEAKRQPILLANWSLSLVTRLIRGPLREALRKKRAGKLSHRPLLQHDHARPHTARQTIDTIAKLGWELLPHAAYSPDLAPSDYHLFGELKKPLRGIHFEDLNAVKRAVHQWILGTPKEFFENGLKQLVQRWKKCIELRGDYVEKRDELHDD